MTNIDTLAALQSTRTNLLFNLAANLPIAKNKNIKNWEELVCVGYNPQFSLLEAVVSIKLASGYSGGLCTTGSPEYVRFFVDFGAGFEHIGLTSFRVHDISDLPAGQQHPLEYLVQLQLNDAIHRRICRHPVIPKVRAVLSWNIPPSINPSDSPHFGNHLDARIQLQPQPFFIGNLVKEGLLKIDQSLLDLVDQNSLVAKAITVNQPLASLVESYKKAEVPAHRFLAPAIQPLLAGGETLASSIAFPSADLVKKLKLDLAAILKDFQVLKGDPAFEQLTCVGLDSATDTLGAVIHVKRPVGYSGDLCHTGSNEYVAFWADWNNNGTFDEYLGTATVNVHDLGSAMPTPEGIRYSVKLNAPQIAKHLRECANPNIIGIRAVLQWNNPPSTTDPNGSIAWGSQLDALVQLRPGRPVVGDELTDLIYRVGSVGLPDISPSTHLAFPTSAFALGCAQPDQDRPWGGLVYIQGRIYNTGLPSSVRYRVRYKLHSDADVDSNWFPVTNVQSYTLMYPLLTPPEVPVTQVAHVEPGLNGGWFDYLENPLVVPPVFERDNMLASWSTGTLEGVYDIRLEYRRATDPAGFYLSSSVVTIVVHNYQMTASIAATPDIDVTKDLDLVIIGGDCHSYTKGTSINLRHRCVDNYFWLWNYDLQPTTHTHGAEATLPCRTYNSLGDHGDSSFDWTFDTTPLDKCGYTLMLRGYDRTIINSNVASTGHSNHKAVGFSVV